MNVKESPAATATFADLFGRAPEVRADAPGRVNLIGEHTDYSGGFVLPLAIPQRTRVELAPRIGALVRASSANVESPEILEYRLGDEKPVHGWLDYVQGITGVLRQDGYTLRGFDLRIESDVPAGARASGRRAAGGPLVPGP